MNDEAKTPSPEDLAICAHDLRGALTVIAGYAALLQREDIAQQERAEAVAGIEAAIARADSILADTVSGRTVLTDQPNTKVSLASVALRAAADARAAFGRDVIVDADERAVVRGEEQGLMRLVENLLSNAAKYAPSGPIELTVTTDGEHAIIQVADRGPGVPVHEREAILAPFARLERDAAAPGSGLGLTVVDSIARNHGGSVSIANREGGGAVFSVAVPV